MTGPKCYVRRNTLSMSILVSRPRQMRLQKEQRRKGIRRIASTSVGLGTGKLGGTKGGKARAAMLSAKKARRHGCADPAARRSDPVRRASPGPSRLLHGDRQTESQGGGDAAEAETRLRHLDRFFTQHRAAGIAPALILTYVQKRQAAGAAAATVNRELATLSRMLRLGYRNSKVQDSREALLLPCLCGGRSEAGGEQSVTGTF